MPLGLMDLTFQWREHEVREGEKEVRQRTNKLVYNIMSSYRPGFLHSQHNLATSLFFK